MDILVGSIGRFYGSLWAGQALAVHRPVSERWAGGPLPPRCDPCPPLRPEKNQGAIYPGKDIVEPITCKHLFFRIWHHRYLCYVPQLK